MDNSGNDEHKSYVQTIAVIDKRLNLITLWNLDTFEYKLSLLRDIYNRYTEEGSLVASSVSSSSGGGVGGGHNEMSTNVLTDSMDEWQTVESYNHTEKFSPRM